MTVLAIPIAFAVSILRYRLWDIDLVIKRALVYTALTAILAGLYSATIAFSQRVLVAFTGTTSDAAIVFTVLVVGSAFTPVKSGLQSIVDRYVKELPDPTQNVRAFGEQVRSLVELIDIEQITRRTLDEAIRAFDARGGAVYLLVNEQPRLVHVEGEWTQTEGMGVWLQSDGARYGWVVLGPRRNGMEYSERDHRVLTDIVALVARAIRLVQGARMGHSVCVSDGSVGPARGGLS